MAHPVRLWRKKGGVRIGDREAGDNTTIPLTESGTIGVCLKDPGRRGDHLHSLESGTDATCAQAPVGTYPC
jgi:hypothetical protein